MTSAAAVMFVLSRWCNKKGCVSKKGTARETISYERKHVGNCMKNESSFGKCDTLLYMSFAATCLKRNFPNQKSKVIITCI